MTEKISRRDLLAKSGARLGAAGLAALGIAAAPSGAALAEEEKPRRRPFGIALNSSTLFGHNLTIVQQIDLAAKAGYDGMEPWAQELEKHAAGGGSLEDLGKRFRDGGLEVVGLIAFPQWAVADPGARKKALEEVKRTMEMAAKIGAKRLAAPPAGNVAGVTLAEAAERYRDLLLVGKQMGVIPSVELWGFAKLLSHLSEVAFVAIESGDPEACMVLDVYHLYKGGGGSAGLPLIYGGSISVLHINDYPNAPPRERITDAHRVFPGDGVAPLGQILKDLNRIGYRGMLSLELFNKEYYKRDALQVAREGLEKTRLAVEKALSR
ncbi:MAG: sugar phosphate isomerase/epimerase [Planctomycetes bacterium]|nr:sugar phosphate isomerase/epimerase [Planctomycetota bacterium]